METLGIASDATDIIIVIIIIVIIIIIKTKDGK